MRARATEWNEVGMLDEFDQRRRHLSGRQNIIRQTGRDRAVRHPVEFCRVFILNHHQAPRLLDRANTARPIAARAGKRDGNGSLAAVKRQRSKETIDRQVQSLFRIPFCQQEVAVGNGQAFSRRDQIDVVWFDGYPFGGLGNRHPRLSRQQCHHHALVIGRQMLDHDKRHPAVVRHRFKERSQRL